MCRISRRKLIVVWSLQKYQTSPQNKGAVAFPEFIGRMHPYCMEHNAALDLVETGTEYMPEQQGVCPKKADGLSERGKAELELGK